MVDVHVWGDVLRPPHFETMHRFRIQIINDKKQEMQTAKQNCTFLITDTLSPRVVKLSSSTAVLTVELTLKAPITTAADDIHK